jgi:ABC-2 type transport system ATP-binding protein
MDLVVEARELTKRYGELVAASRVSLRVEEGEIFGLVGPNGAGKTTLIECLEGLRVPNAGEVRVLGLNSLREGRQLRERIGVQLQTTFVQPDIKVREALALFASFYQRTLDPEGILRRLHLEEQANVRYRKLSGGLKQRVALALALVGDPELLFLDEPTTGLDPQARRNTWELVEELRQEGRTVFLTTHYMEEAERLCDRVGIMDHGEIVALDAPRRLVAALGAESKVIFSLEGGAVGAPELARLAEVSRVEESEDAWAVYTRDENATLQELVGWANARGLRLGGLHTERPTLEDVFLTLTGREYRD